MSTASSSSSSSSSIIAEVHPLVIAAACDHFIRLRSNGMKLPSYAPVVGLLFGTLSHSTSTTLVIKNTSQLNAQVATAQSIQILDAADIERKTRLYQGVFPNDQLIGWYAFGSMVTPEFIHNHHLVASKTNASPFIFILFDEIPPHPTSEEIPILAYTSATTTAGEGAGGLVPVKVEIHSTEVEKIAMEQVMQAIPLQGKTYLEVQNQSIETSLTILQKKLHLLVQTIEFMKAGKIAEDPVLLRLASKVFHTLNALQESSSASNEEQSFLLQKELMEQLALPLVGLSLQTTQAMLKLHQIQGVVNHDRLSLK